MRPLSENTNRKIAVYSGSFNPLHIGHLAIIRYLTADARYDAVYLIVSPKNPLKDSIDSSTGTQRYKAAVEAVGRHFKSVYDVADIPMTPAFPSVEHPLAGGDMSSPLSTTSETTAKVVVDGIELNMSEPHYTIRTLDALQEREPSGKFTFIMGADSLADIRRWKDYRRILTEYGVAVYPREGHDLTAIRQDLLEEDPEYKIELLDAPEVTVSSTEIRKAMSEGIDISHLLM